MNKTLDYYNRNADAFVEGSVAADMSRHYSEFLKFLPAGAAILDLGCGSGRDTRYFSSLGYTMTAVDGSRELCRKASEYTGIDVCCLTFDALDYEEQFDGIWACASLLHVPKAEMAAVLDRVSRALRPGGILYASYKYGTAEREKDGRFFSDYTEKDLPALFGAHNGFRVLTSWSNEDVRPDRNEKWLNVIAKKIDVK